MSATSAPAGRLLSIAEHEMVEQTKPPQIDQLPKAELQALVRRLREARNRAQRIGCQQIGIPVTPGGLNADHGSEP